MSNIREERRHTEHTYTSPRSNFQRDCDRILYCSAWPRLAHITQIVSPTADGIYHNRLTHSLKVAQLGRRIAENISSTYTKKEDLLRINDYGGLDPDVLEAAGRAHDLGHPPFGHVGEKVLNGLVTKAGLLSGFEGNAQSFRILTKLSYRGRESSSEGLNLTRATLNSVIKYPWKKGENANYPDKWGYYETEFDDFQFARSESRLHRRSLEAEILDYADDVAYSIYDIDDFYRSGFIPLSRLHSPDGITVTDEGEKFLKSLAERESIESNKLQKLREVFLKLASAFPSEPYDGSKVHRGKQRDRTAAQVNRYIVKEVKLDPDGNSSFLLREGDIFDELYLLKQITVHYIIDSSGLLIRQAGQKSIIETVFNAYLEAAKNGKFSIFPILQREQLSKNHSIILHNQIDKWNQDVVRIIADMIAASTEEQLIQTFQALTGSAVRNFASMRI